MPGSKYCPVQSYLTYFYALDKNNDYLWQRRKFKDFPENGKGVWYGPQRVGHNLLDSFITNLAKEVGFSDLGYTNHSLRVAAINNLKRQNFSDKHGINPPQKLVFPHHL